MLDRALRRITSAADLLRPRTFFRTLARVDDVADSTRELRALVEQLQMRTEQLMAIERLDWEQREDLERLAGCLDEQRIAAHVRAAVASAALEHDPFPHVVVHRWLPEDTYAILRGSVPPAVFFADRDPTRQRLLVPFPLAPAYAQRVWRFVANVIVGRILSGALNDKFEGVVRDYVRSFCPGLPDGFDLTLHPSDGRIMLRRRGYVIPPHRDPKWGFVTGLVYLARKRDNEAYGTRLYRVRADEEAPSGRPFYVDESRCELAKAVPYRPNVLLAFLNSGGAHGASIPADAEPADLERYVYQFRLGPDRNTISTLLSAMPAERRALWAGAKAERAGGYDS
jgi:hypothetical protein